MVTIADVARAAQVSPMTVSNVLNDRPQVAPGTRRRVLDAVDELGYQVNVAARNLRSGRTGRIALAVPEVDRPYNSQLAARIIRAAGAHGLRVVVEETGARKEDELAAIARSRLRLYDGVIVSAVGLRTEDLEQMSLAGPVVLLGERTTTAPVDHVGLPNVEGARCVVRHLIERGRRRIALLGAPPGVDGDPPADAVDAALLRGQAYCAELRAHGLRVDADLLVACPEWSLAGGEAAARQLLAAAGDVDAVFALTDTLAIGALRHLADAGVRVPDDVAVAGFDNVEETRYSIPRLTTLAPDHDEVATTAVAFLAERIARGADAGAPRDVTSRFELLVREST